MRTHPAIFGREAERQGYVERLQRFHLAIKPFERVGAETIRPTQAGA
jgi:hypothetical protein